MFKSFLKKSIFSLLISTAAFSNVYAVAYDMEDWIFNINGTTHEAYYGDLLPTTGVLVDGLGTLSLEITDAGTHSISSFFDYEIDQFVNGYTNESAQAVGTLVNTYNAIQSWEIDEPKYYFGDIIDNVLIGSLDNTNAVPAGSEDDVGFGMGWEIALLEGDIATIDFVFTDIVPTAEFYIAQYDPDSDAYLYFYSTINIQTSGTPAGPEVPPVVSVNESAPLSLMLLGLIALLLARKPNAMNKRAFRM